MCGKNKISICFENLEVKTIEDNKEQLLYVSSAHEKYLQMFKEFKKHPYKIIEYYSGIKLSLWQRIYFDTIGKLKKTDYEKQQMSINKAIRPYIKKI